MEREVQERFERLEDRVKRAEDRAPTARLDQLARDVGELRDGRAEFEGQTHDRLGSIERTLARLQAAFAVDEDVQDDG